MPLLGALLVTDLFTYIKMHMQVSYNVIAVVVCTSSAIAFTVFSRQCIEIPVLYRIPSLQCFGHSVNNRTVEQLPLVTLSPPPGVSPFVEWSRFHTACWLTMQL